MRCAGERLVLVGALVAVFSAPALAQKHVPMTDQQIQAQVEPRLSEQSIPNVTVTVGDGVVTLGGTVPSLWAKNEAIEQARKADDVKSVVSELTVARGESDQRIAEQVASRVRRHVFYTIFDDVDIAVNGGGVKLTGRVTMPFKASEIADLASRVQGVQEIDNQIQTLPASISDEQLRYSIAGQIYRDPMFWNYAIQVSPPIHVVVENGRVTLTGVVNSEVERRKAELIARSTFGVFAVDNRLRVERGS